MTSESFKWYALYTKPRWEKKVAELLTRKKVEAYCPLNRTVRQWSDRKKAVYEPLFRSYVFVRASEKMHNELREIDGVVNLVFWLGKPAVIRDNEIEMIKRFLNDFQTVQLEKTQVGLHDKVVITGGSMMHREGNVIEVRHKSVKVILSSIGYALIAEVDKALIEKVSFLHNSTQDSYTEELIKIAT